MPFILRFKCPVVIWMSDAIRRRIFCPFYGVRMFINNNSFDKKRRLLILAAAILVACCVPAGGFVAFGKMLDIGRAHAAEASSNETAP